MKKLVYLIVTGLLCCSGMLAQKLVQIKGNGFGTFGEVTLKQYSPEILGYESLETKTLNEDGRFSFQIPFLGDNLFELNFDEKEMVHLSIPRAGNITASRVKNSISIEGSPNSVEMQEFARRNGALQAKHFGELKAAMDKAMKAGDKERIDALQQQAAVALQSFLVEFRELIVNMGTDSAGFYALQYTDFNKERVFVEERLKAFKKESPGTVPTRALEKLVNQAKSTEIGEIPPDFKVSDRAGHEVTLSQFKGKVLLIDFWAHWCRPCRVEHPKIASILKKYRNMGFHVLSITQDVDKVQWEKAIAKDGIEDFQHVFDSGNRINDLYSVSSLPQNVLLNRAGKIIAKNVKAEALEQILENLR
ncbi:TlpA family protein disulfide reductase [Muricauda sp. SCSIO 64092]|uniref:TlpA family protein disulfide reductase n=1 Tax=Allomuricauda sp. SCSIO 64092 TaxID=2908842 RepID=UPI001FF3648B|nr:TlpA disulfide reductase family protein [Muricauda sp. SCSIO 64092]UOY06346.1 TlpA family protein disulfide reductase [Muricauda sp. SCSIO 64092]